MIARVKEAALVTGTVADVRFSPSKNVAYVDFDLGRDTFTFEFKNGKKPRADHVRRLRLKKGDEAVAIGAVSEGSALYGFGYDVSTSGRVEKDSYAILSGTVEKVVRGRNSGVVCLKDDEGKTRQLKCRAEDAAETEAGDKATALCQSWSAFECEKRCGEASVARCAECERKKKTKRYDAIKLSRV